MSNYSMIFSPTGGTKKVADILTGAIGGSWQQIDLCKSAVPLPLHDGDVCLVSVPSYGGRVPGLAIEHLRTFSGNGAKAILVCVYGNRAWEDTLAELQDTLESGGFVCAAAVAAVAEHSIFRQYATNRPDAADAAQLASFAQKIRQKLDHLNDPHLDVPGHHGTYKEYRGVPFKPTADKHCADCGLCVRSCPAGAIDPTNPHKTDKEKCISCMRCVTMCPHHARELNTLAVSGAAAAMSKALSGRKNNELFL